MIEAKNNITHFIQEPDSLWERSQLIRDEVTNILTERLTKNIYALSVRLFRSRLSLVISPFG